MFSLKSRKDAFRLLLPKDFIVPEVEKKYDEVLKAKHGYYKSSIDFINETIQSVEVLGFTGATMPQQQETQGKRALVNRDLDEQAQFAHSASEYVYRSQLSPIALVDKTLNITFRHTLGFLNYFLLFENFWYLYAREQESAKIPSPFCVDIFNEYGSIYARIVLDSPVIDSMDMLDLTYTQPVASSESFKIIFKYSNFDFQFLNIDKEETLNG